MKLKQFILLACCLIAASASAQSLHSEAQPVLTDGILNLSLGDKSNSVRIGGYISANGHLTEVKNDKNDNGFDIEHAFLSVEGSFLNDKLGFFLQTDFTLSYPLLDAYVTYQPAKDLVFSVGQKQTFTNSRDMLMRDQLTAFGGQHSHMSQLLNKTGRELGVFAEYRLPVKSFGADLGVAVTSGDGRNSFGSSSTDNDKGGLKYGGRITLYPLGYFVRGNELVFHDFVREAKPKIALGAAISFNDGVSEAVGEGHGDFTFYDEAGEVKLPDYRKYAADLLLKWQGLTLLVDYQKTSATHLNHLYTAQSVESKLRPTQIANYLALGTGLDVQAGYLFKSLWTIDAAWSYIHPEFDETDTSALNKVSSFDFGVSKYFCKNALRLQLAANYTKYNTVYFKPYKNRSVLLSAHVMF